MRKESNNKYLLDTHILLWALSYTDDNPTLPPNIHDIIINPDNEIFYGFVNVWEVGIKHMKHPDGIDYDSAQFDALCAKAGFKYLIPANSHIFSMETLVYDNANAPQIHKDPFDRLLLAQAKAEGMMLITHDHLLPYYNEKCVLVIPKKVQMDKIYESKNS